MWERLSALRLPPWLAPSVGWSLATTLSQPCRLTLFRFGLKTRFNMVIGLGLYVEQLQGP
jgi:hypothetical protein